MMIVRSDWFQLHFARIKGWFITLLGSLLFVDNLIAIVSNKKRDLTFSREPSFFSSLIISA